MFQPKTSKIPLNKIERQSNLTLHSPQIKRHRGLLEVDVLLRSLQFGLESVIPGEIHSVDVVLVDGDKVVAGREGIGGRAFEIGAHLFGDRLQGFGLRVRSS
ncbi:hypothetical protein LOK49_LG07G01773 [Camellia lanceoleosa]|uniref:Uncharacterized protein n=1 Tax=Camellia lanceoleosa TaxID=1840588 RepID=A0ACC0H583_9ERIC|nr:hypothetical protein LOK49_LG07G01773 [Camellia lanceoleosa]